MNARDFELYKTQQQTCFTVEPLVNTDSQGSTSHYIGDHQLAPSHFERYTLVAFEDEGNAPRRKKNQRRTDAEGSAEMVKMTTEITTVSSIIDVDAKWKKKGGNYCGESYRATHLSRASVKMSVHRLYYIAPVPVTVFRIANTQDMAVFFCFIDHFDCDARCKSRASKGLGIRVLRMQHTAIHLRIQLCVYYI